MNDREKLTDKARYPHEIAEFYGIQPATLANWLKRSPLAYLLKRNRKYYTPAEVKLIIDYFDLTEPLN